MFIKFLIKKFASDANIDLIETSAKNSSNINEAFDKLVSKMKQHSENQLKTYAVRIFLEKKVKY